MTPCYSITLLLLTPFVLLGQVNGGDSNNSNIVLSKEVYSIIQTVIKKEKLNKKYGIMLTPEENCNINKVDSIYLQTLLIKPQAPDTLQNTDSSSFVFVSNLSWPDKNIFTAKDIDNILKNKSAYKEFKWDNDKLGFNLKNKKYYYTFSIPYFNSTHDKVILMYRFLCPGLCGGGSTIVLNKKGTNWDITALELWFH